MFTSGSLGSLLQGVSQQAAQVRPIGTVTEQINYISDVVRGLTSRPATNELGIIPNKSETSYRLTEVQFDGEWFIMGFRPGDLVMWGLDGTEYTVVEGPGTAPLAYIGEDMRPYVFNDSLFIVNRAEVVAKAADPLPAQSPSNVGVVYSLGGALYESFAWRIVYPDGTIASAAYNTSQPNSPGAGDYLTASAPRIALGLYNSMLASADLKPTTTLTRVNGTIGIVDSATDFSMEISDPGSGLLRGFTSSLDSVEDLSETAPHGMVVKINNSDAGNEDDFYMRFKSETATVLGTGIGSAGVWEEWFNETEVSTFDLSTMPHVVEKTGPTEFTLGEGDWYGRRTGDADTNPFSDFLGHAIRDIGGFQSRLVLVAGATCAMSQSKEPLDFFKRSVTVDIDTDPISIQATSTDGEEVRLDWIIPFDRDIVFMSDPGKGQYIITGSSKATPDNTAIVKTTAFEMRGGAKPVETGKTILFPFTSGSFSGINEFFTNQEVAVNSVNTLTETVTRYIPGEVIRARVSTNFSVACFASDDAATNNTLWVYKYLWQDSTKAQSAWSKWVFPSEVRHFFFDNSRLYVMLAYPGGTDGEVDYVVTYLDLNLPLDPDAGFHVCIDRKQPHVASATNTVTLAFSGAVFAQGAGCASPGREVGTVAESARSATGQVTYTFDPVTVPEGATVLCGLRYSRLLNPSRPYARGSDGSPRPRTKVVVDGYTVEYEETGFLHAEVQSIYRSDPIATTLDWFPLDDDPEDPNAVGIRDGLFYIPAGERADWSELIITSDDIRPSTIIEVEWSGEAFKGSRE